MIKIEELKFYIEKKKDDNRLSFFKYDFEEFILFFEFYIIDGEVFVFSGYLEK